MTKPRRGQCGTCHWWDYDASQANGQRVGRCMVNPPVAAQTMMPGGIGPQGPMVRPAWQGIRPPTLESDRCSKWHPAGQVPLLELESAPHSEVN